MKISDIRRYLEKEIWQLNLSKVKGLRRYGILLLRSLTIAWRDFKKDNCQLKASALTFYTMLSVVPVIAMLFGIAKGFGLEKKLEANFKTDLSYNQEMITYVFDFANSMLENTKGGLIAGLGVAMLFWTVMKVLSNIENAFNDIWEINSSRTWVRKFSDYMSLMLLAPVLIILSNSILYTMNSQIVSATNSIEILGYFGPVIFFILEMMPFLLTIVLFTMMYVILPNTRVRFSAAFFGALFASAIFVLVEWLYLSFQIGVSKYNAIYGGFAALPLFLGWIQVNWLIVLLGAELSFAFQNQGKYEFEIESIEISHSFRFRLSIAVINSMVKKFMEGEEGPTAQEISESMHIPSKLVRRILNDLVNCRVISEVGGGNKSESTYMPAIDLSKLDMNFVWRRMSDYGINEIPVEMSDDMLKIEQVVLKAQEGLFKSGENLLIKDL